MVDLESDLKSLGNLVYLISIHSWKALRLGLHGASVSIMGRRPEVLEEAVSALCSNGIRATHVIGDVRYEDQCLAAVKHTQNTFNGSLDILINSAAGNFLAKAENLNLKGFRTGFF